MITWEEHDRLQRERNDIISHNRSVQLTKRAPKKLVPPESKAPYGYEMTFDGDYAGFIIADTKDEAIQAFIDDISTDTELDDYENNPDAFLRKLKTKKRMQNRPARR